MGFLAGARGRMPGSRGIRMLEFAVSKDAHVFGACGMPRVRRRGAPPSASLRSEAAIELMRPSGKGRRPHRYGEGVLDD